MPKSQPFVTICCKQLA